MKEQYYIQELLTGRVKEYSYGCGDISKVKESFSNSFMKVEPEKLGETHPISKKAFYLALWRQWPDKENEVKKILQYSSGNGSQISRTEKVIVNILSWFRK